MTNNPSQKCDYNYETCCNNLEKHCPADQLPEEPEYSYCKKCGDHCRYQVKKSRIPKSEKCKNGKPCPWCQSESPATPKLNVKGQCPYCSKKPLMYKRDGGYYFCTRCNRQWDLAGNFQENFMWNRNNKCKHPGRPKNSSCPDCGEWDTESRQNNDNLGKAMQPVERVSEKKPSTGEDWWEELKRDCKILQKYGEDTDYIIENTVIPFIRSLLQKERERAVNIIQKFKDAKIPEPFKTAMMQYLQGIQIEILKDNQSL